MKDLDTLKMDELHGILIAYEMKRMPKFQRCSIQGLKIKKGERMECQ